MREPVPKQVVALRLAHLATKAWGGSDLGALADAAEVAQAYLGALAILFSFVVRSIDKLAGRDYTDADLDVMLGQWVADVKKLVQGQREGVVPGLNGKEEVH